MNIKNLLEIAITASIYAGHEIMQVYKSNDFEVSSKEDDSPLTIADTRANDKISEYLKETDIPVLSEEGRDIAYEERKNWEYFWLVDPLDGTKEFINKNGEFTVNIALIKNNTPIAGVIYVPVLKQLYFGAEEIGAYKIEDVAVIIKGLDLEQDDINYNQAVILIDDEFIADYNEYIENSKKLPLNHFTNEKYTVVGSRSHKSPENEEYLKNLEKEHKKIEIKSKGSSLKFCLIAEGEADIYPRLGPTMEWDTAAGDAIVRAAGGTVLKTDETDLIYNKKELLNPYFIVKAPEKIIKDSKDCLKRTRFLSKKYPEVPELHYLPAKTYNSKDVTDKFSEHVNILKSQFPDYLYSTLCTALKLQVDSQDQDSPTIFFDLKDISELAPNRKEFHIEELILYYNVQANNYILDGKLEKAKEYLSLMDELDEHHPLTEDIYLNIESVSCFSEDNFDDDDFDDDYFEDDFDDTGEESKDFKIDFYEEDTDIYEKDIQISEEPEFINQEIKELYKYDYNIDKNIIEKILKLPRKTLIKDLETVIIDSIERFEFFILQIKNEKNQIDKIYFPVHAWLLLVELKADINMSILKRVLKQGGDFINFWYEFTYVFSTVFYVHLSNNTAFLYEMLTSKGMSKIIRENILLAMRNIGLRQADKKLEIISYYRKFMQFLIENKNDNKIFDYELNEQLIDHITDLRIKELIPEIKTFYNDGLLTFSLIEDFYELKKRIKSEPEDYKSHPIYTDIYSEYNEFKDMFNDGFLTHNFINEPEITHAKNDISPDNDDEHNNNQKTFSGKKAGRNDPCPCGSGKKYKKCCIN